MLRDLMPVHPELRAVWKKFPRLPYNRWTIYIIRWFMSLMPAAKLPEEIKVSQVYAESQDSNHKVMLRIYQPGAATPVPVLLWIHGGGLVIGSTKTEDAYVSKFVKELGIVVVSVEYRLAPDHPYPAAIEDSYTALQWVCAHARSLRIDPDRIAVGGESAGGGLAASLAQMAHDRGEIKLVFQLLVYPMLDDRSALCTGIPHPKLLTWTPKDNRFGWESYLKQSVGLENVPPYSVSARRENLSGLPPAWIGVGTLDLFYEEDRTYAEKLKDWGVDCEFVVVEGAFHGFDVFDDPAAPVQDFRNAQVAALKLHLLKDEGSRL